MPPSMEQSVSKNEAVNRSIPMGRISSPRTPSIKENTPRYTEGHLADIASQLTSYRYAKGLSVSGLAKEMKVHRRNLARFLQGRQGRYCDVPQYERFLTRVSAEGDPRQFKLPGLIVYGTWKLHHEVRDLSRPSL